VNNLKINKNELLEKPLDQKIQKTKTLIMDWYEQFDGNVYVSFSGGKDSTILLQMVRELYPDVPAVFANTGLEFPEIVSFVKSFDNVEILKPKMTFKETLEKYGFPIISKNVSMAISRARNTKSDEVRRFRLFGRIDKITGRKKVVGTVPKKWHHIYESDLPVTDRCCYVFKKEPFKRYEKKTGRKPFIGTMARESMNRAISYRQGECNEFNSKNPKSQPLMFWTDDDVWKYIRDFNVKLAEPYRLGYKRTGCVFCAYGVHLEKEGETRFDLLKKTHPKLYYYCMDKLGFRKALGLYLGRDV